MVSKHFLCDELAFSFFADSKPKFTERQIGIIKKKKNHRQKVEINKK